MDKAFLSTQQDTTAAGTTQAGELETSEISMTEAQSTATQSTSLTTTTATTAAPLQTKIAPEKSVTPGKASTQQQNSSISSKRLVLLLNFLIKFNK